MYPKVFISNSFLDEFGKAEKSIPKTSLYAVDSELELKNQSLRRIRDLFLSSHLYSDIGVEELEKLQTLEFGVATNIKELIFHSIIKERSNSTSKRSVEIKCKRGQLKEGNVSFFLGESRDACRDFSEKEGRVCLGLDFIESPFFLDHSFPPIITDATLYQIKELKHPCSSLLIIDKYLFKDKKGNPPKIPNLINVIEYLIPENLEGKFEIDIISENQNYSNYTIDSKVKQLTDYFGDKISLHVYVPGIISEESDRFFITNYMVIVIPHPLDRNTTLSSSLFLSQEKPERIIEGYGLMKSKVHLGHNIIKKTPKTFGTIKSMWKTDDLKHSIFNQFQ